MPHCLISLGANQGDRAATMENAVAILRSDARLRNIRCSRRRVTRPIGGPEGQEAYLNGAARFETDLAPDDVLALLLDVESQFGRVRETHWGPRPLDLDLLLYDDLILTTARLTLPHPRMAWRRFVLEPAAEIAGEMRHPTIGVPLAELWASLCTDVFYAAIVGPPGVGKSEAARRLAGIASVQCILDASPPRACKTADQSGPQEAEELEWLDRRAALLEAAQRRRVASGESAPMRIVSDFWLPQSPAYASLRSGGCVSPGLCETVERYASRVVQPQLVVLLEPSEASEAASAKLCDALRDVVRARHRGPVLQRRNTDLDAVVREIAVALESMLPD